MAGAWRWLVLDLKQELKIIQINPNISAEKLGSEKLSGCPNIRITKWVLYSHYPFLHASFPSSTSARNLGKFPNLSEMHPAGKVHSRKGGAWWKPRWRPKIPSRSWKTASRRVWLEHGEYGGGGKGEGTDWKRLFC